MFIKPYFFSNYHLLYLHCEPLSSLSVAVLKLIKIANPCIPEIKTIQCMHTVESGEYCNLGWP